MSVSLKIPTPLRRMTNGESSATVEGTNIMECIDSLDALHPGIKARLVADTGELHRFVNVYVNGEDIRFRTALPPPLTAATRSASSLPSQAASPPASPQSRGWSVLSSTHAVCGTTLTYPHGTF